MRLALILALQAAPEPAFDLATLPKPPPRCGESGGEIVVCGRADPDRYRLKPPAGGFDAQPLRAETSLGGGTIGVTTEQVQMGSATSNRVMARFRIKF